MTFEFKACVIFSVYVFSGKVSRPRDYFSQRVKWGIGFVAIIIWGDERDMLACGTLGSHFVIGTPVVVDQRPTVLGHFEFIH